MPVEWQRRERVKAAMSDLEEGGATVLMETIERGHAFTIEEWQEKAGKLNETQTVVLQNRLVEKVLSKIDPSLAIGEQFKTGANPDEKIRYDNYFPAVPISWHSAGARTAPRPSWLRGSSCGARAHSLLCSAKSALLVEDAWLRCVPPAVPVSTSLEYRVFRWNAASWS